LSVLYEYATWSLTIREEHTLRVFEKKGLKRIFAPKREDVTGGLRRLGKRRELSDSMVKDYQL
jgi:hypothetical protein